jgi:hypothetical protein
LFTFKVDTISGDLIERTYVEVGSYNIPQTYRLFLLSIAADMFQHLTVLTNILFKAYISSNCMAIYSLEIFE